MFIIKKLIGLLIEPLAFSLLLLLLGFLLLRRRPVMAKSLQFIAIAVLYLCSTDWLSDSLLLPLERRYPAWQPALLSDTGLADMPAEVPVETPVEVIVVLGGGHHSDSALPLTSQLKSFSLARLTEGVRIWHRYPDSLLILSGFAGHTTVSNAEMMSRLALELGVSPHSIWLQPTPRDTAEEARLIAPLLQGKNSVLVTSSYHMPRAMALFQAQGAEPVPAPTEHLAAQSGSRGMTGWLPTAHDLAKCSRAVHEYAGLLWSWLNGQLVSAAD